MADKNESPQYLLCVKNEDFPTSLELRKLYRLMPDSIASKRGFVRVIDESGDDYLYPSRFFVAIDLPQTAINALAETA